FTFIKELNPNLISGSFAYLVGIVLMLFIMLIILIPVLIITMIADSPIRDTIYKLHYKIELVDYKFSQACKNNQILPSYIEDITRLAVLVILLLKLTIT